MVAHPDSVLGVCPGRPLSKASMNQMDSKLHQYEGITRIVVCTAKKYVTHQILLSICPFH